MESLIAALVRPWEVENIDQAKYREFIELLTEMATRFYDPDASALNYSDDELRTKWAELCSSHGRDFFESLEEYERAGSFYATGATAVLHDIEYSNSL